MARIPVILGISFALFTGLVSVAAEKPAACRNYPTGTSFEIPLGSDFESLAASKNHRWLAVREWNGTTHVVDLRSRTDSLIGKSIAMNFSENGKALATLTDPTSVEIRDLTSGKSTKIKLVEPATGVHLSADGSTVVLKTANGLTIERLPKGPKRKFSLDPRSVCIAPSATHAVQSETKGGWSILDLRTGKREPVTLPGDPDQLVISPNGRFAVVETSNGVVLFDFERRARRGLPAASSDFVFAPDGNHVFVSEGNGLVRADCANPKLDRRIDVPFYVREIGLSKDGTEVAVSDHDRYGYQDAIFSVRSLKLKAPIVKGDSDGMSPLEHFDSAFSVVRKRHHGEDKKALTVIARASSCFGRMKVKESDCAHCATESRPKTDPSPADLAALEKPLEKLLCTQPWSDHATSRWESLTGRREAGDLTVDRARAYLLRFQKPGGFHAERDLPVLLGILDSPALMRDSTLIDGALASVLYDSNQLYEKLLAEYPVLKKPRKTFSSESPCRTAGETEKIRKAVVEYYRYTTTTNAKKFEEWEYLRPLAPVLGTLPEDQKAEFHDVIAQSIADRAGLGTSPYYGIFPSKIYKFTYEATAPLFNETPKPLTDLTVVYESGRVRPIVLGTDPIGGDPKSMTEFGFSAYRFPEVAIPAEKTEKYRAKKVYSWDHGGHHYVADLHIAGIEKKFDRQSRADGPDYKSMWKDGALNGIVVSGSNLRSAYTIGQYLSYYQKQGFRFGRASTVTDLRDYLRDQISSGSADYLVKEAHSDGDEKNLFRVDNVGVIQVGTLERDGKKETVTLVFPAADPKGSQYISNSDFGAWIKAREKNSGGQLAYFNTSCWAHQKAVSEVSAANSPLFLDFASTHTASTFVDGSHSTLRAMLHGFRNREDYDGMREAMKKTPNYASGRKDSYLFPDEKEYQEKIFKASETPLDLQVSVKKDGAPYHIDEH